MCKIKLNLLGVVDVLDNAEPVLVVADVVDLILVLVFSNGKRVLNLFEGKVLVEFFVDELQKLLLSEHTIFIFFM